MRSITPEQHQRMQLGKRRAAFDSIADPLWRAIARGHSQEVARLQDELRRLIARQAGYTPHEDRQLN